MDGDQEARNLLVDLLREAASLEHCLLDAYLFTASCLKSTPDEFSRFKEKPNRRRAIQFERARAWKQSILVVAHEEMLHLHYVQCMLRALGEAPYFALPKRNEAGNWLIPNWRAQVAGTPDERPAGMEIAVSRLTIDNIRRFVLYESTDSLQDDNPFGEKVTDLLKRLHDFEMDLHFEGVLLNVEDDDLRKRLKEKLCTLYDTLTPLPAEEGILDQERLAPGLVALPGVAALPPLEELRFQSIADLYQLGILPLYEEAFDLGWVKHANVDLSNEIAPPLVRGKVEAGELEGLLPIGPVYRNQNFKKAFQESQGPLRNYKDIHRIIREIVEEGEGQSAFERRAEMLLAAVAANGGARAYLKAYLKAKQQNQAAPKWIDDGELLRNSHLYRFAMIMVELNEEISLASGDFVAARSPNDVDDQASLQQLTRDLPMQFNACYLALRAWLSRIYEIPDWKEDKPERAAIEVLAAWPMMSTAIRPFLELASFFPISSRDLFRTDPDSLPLLPLHARQLYELYASPKRSEEINTRMDYLVVRILADAAQWATEQRDAVQSAKLTDCDRRMILRRLDALSVLDEFEKQFPFHVHGGYSNLLPDLPFQLAEPDAHRFEEDPSSLKAPLYQDALVVRLRFSGWGIVQLATDPDPPTDESGCTGTHMLHAADGRHTLDRALIWQAKDATEGILREPRAHLPPVGVNCVDISLCVTNSQTKAGYIPLQVMQSVGAVQTDGVQQDLKIEGLLPILTLSPRQVLGDGGKITANLLPKSSRKPALQGMNHLVWRDGEPIDPFIIAVAASKAGAAPELLLSREVFNEERPFLEMSPLQRTLSARGPCGFDDIGNIPDWVLAAMSAEDRNKFQNPQYPISYLGERANVLAHYLAKMLGKADDSQEYVDAVVSLAERLVLVNVPLRTTIGWLTILLHYGHTVSGVQRLGKDSTLLDAIATQVNLKLGITDPPSGRSEPNSRWLLKYTLGAMDTDALSNLIFAELYVPVKVAAAAEGPIRFAQRWALPGSIKPAVTDYACRFDAPFWADYKVEGKTRRLTMPHDIKITETLRKQEENGYSYELAGLKGLTRHEAAFSLREGDKAGIILEWSVAFQCSPIESSIPILTFFAAAAEAMTNAIKTHFAPIALTVLRPR